MNLLIVFDVFSLVFSKAKTNRRFGLAGGVAAKFIKLNKTFLPDCVLGLCLLFLILNTAAFEYELHITATFSGGSDLNKTGATNKRNGSCDV